MTADCIILISKRENMIFMVCVAGTITGFMHNLLCFSDSSKFIHYIEMFMKIVSRFTVDKRPTKPFVRITTKKKNIREKTA